jgi:gluconolactonase
MIMRRGSSSVLIGLSALVGFASCAGNGSGDSTGMGSGGSGGAAVGTGTGGGGGGSGGSTAGTGGGGAGGTAPDGGSGGGTGGAGGANSTGAWRCPAGMTFAPPTLTGLMPQRLTGVPPADTFGQGFSIIEGPVWIGDALYLSQILGGSPMPPQSRILKLVPGSPATVIAPDDGTNGLAVDSMGRMFAAIHKDGTICQIPLDNPSSPNLFLAGYMGTRFSAPNDLAIRSDGIVYFSDPHSQQAPNPAPQAKEAVYRGSLTTYDVSVVDDTLTFPNGVTLSLDEKTLFVSGGSGLLKYSVAADGSTSGRAPFGAGTAYTGSDGMTMDCAGDLYMALHNTVVVLDPSGNEIKPALTVPGVQAVTNVAFGGADHKTLFITTLDTSPGVFTVQMPLPGMPY